MIYARPQVFYNDFNFYSLFNKGPQGKNKNIIELLIKIFTNFGYLSPFLISPYASFTYFAWSSLFYFFDLIQFNKNSLGRQRI